MRAWRPVPSRRLRWRRRSRRPAPADRGNAGAADRLAHGPHRPGEADQQVDAEHEEDARHPGRGDLGGETTEQRGAEKGTDRAGQRDAPDGAPVDVAEPPVGGAGGEGGADLGQMHRGRGRRRRDADQQEQRRGRHPVRHAEGAVDELCGEPDQCENQQLAHGVLRIFGIPYRLGRQCAAGSARSTRHAPSAKRTVPPKEGPVPAREHATRTERTHLNGACGARGRTVKGRGAPTGRTRARGAATWRRRPGSGRSGPGAGVGGE